MNKRFLRILIFPIIAFIFATFMVPSPIPAADTIKLGVAGSHSGDLASYGIPTVRAAELVSRDINAKGGILGKRVELLVEDDVCKPEVATNTAAKLVSQGAHVVLGHICSGATKSAIGIYKEARIIVLSPSATNTELTQSGKYKWRHADINDLDAIAYYLKYQANPDQYREKIRAVIDYNEDDCRATKLIKDWLQGQYSSSV